MRVRTNNLLGYCDKSLMGRHFEGWQQLPFELMTHKATKSFVHFLYKIKVAELDFAYNSITQNIDVILIN